jgi:hypothetical protein
MNLKEKIETIRTVRPKIPVLSPMGFMVEAFKEDGLPPRDIRLDVYELVSRMKISLDTRDKHIKELQVVINKLTSMGLSFDELERYKRIYMNDYYEYAKWKPCDEDEFLNN